jgi:AcrR family transcriptional regulator
LLRRELSGLEEPGTRFLFNSSTPASRQRRGRHRGKRCHFLNKMIKEQTFFYLCIAMRTKDAQKELMIRQKTMEIVVKEGLEGFSMHKLAAGAGISVNTIYLNFKNKEDLIIKVYQGVVKKMEQVLLEGFDPDMDFASGLKLQWKNRLKYFMKYPLHIEFTEHIRHSPLYEKVMKLQGRKFTGTMHHFYEKAIKNKELIRFPLEVYWSLAYAPLFQLLKFHRQNKSMSGKKFVLTEKQFNQAFSRVLISLTP